MTPDDLAAELLEATLDADPLAGSLYGFPGYDARLPDFSEPFERAQGERLAALAQQAERFDDAGLSEVQLQTLDFVRRMAGNMAGAATVPLVEFTICDTFVDPVDSVLTLLPKLALDTQERQDGYVARLRGLAEMLATVADRHREGTAEGRTAVGRLVKSTMTKLELLTTDETVGGIAYSGHDDADFVGRVSDEIDTHVRPALTRYRESLATDVLPAARDDEHPGICYLPDGHSMYAKLVQLHTSTRLSADELHATGIEIVEQVSDEFRQTGSTLWGTTDLGDIFERLTHDLSLRYENREEMLEHARRVVAAAEAEAPKWFGIVPKEACVVEPVPETEEAGMAAAYYLVGAIDGSRKGTYFLNTSQPEERHRYAAEDVAFHEAVPGHHFQLTIALEDTELAPARRVLFDTACAEGWGLYSERLADEMGLYTDDLSRMGLFAADAWRAARLVVDTGLHAKGWTRAQAVDWLVAHTPMPRIEMESEVDRYISYPGQALAYMTGRLEIVRLRREASERLGDRFDLREFHDVVLKAGSLPLPALANTVERWVARSAV
jgi:uncharacterized protein (DUF885 family)